jgi:branched-chain amino acid transport system permease protein
VTRLAELRQRAGRNALILVLVGTLAGIAARDLAREGSLVRLANNLVDGVSNGSIWALVAIGYTLVYGIVELINFAHGEVFMIGSFVAVATYATFGLGLATGGPLLVLGLVACLLVAALASGALNVMIERVGYRPLRNSPRLAPLITAVGFSFILLNVGLLWRGGSPASVPDLIRSQAALFHVGEVTVTNGDALATVGAAPLIVGLALFITRTRLGKAMRACAQDPDAARLMGINVDATISATFLLGGLMAGAAGLFYALYQTTIWYFQGFTAGLIAFTAAVMGGIGNLKGAVLGGLVIGVIQQLSDNRIGSEWTPAVVFSSLVLVMVLRPEGLLGEHTRRAR